MHYRNPLTGTIHSVPQVSTAETQWLHSTTKDYIRHMYVIGDMADSLYIKLSRHPRLTDIRGLEGLRNCRKEADNFMMQFVDDPADFSQSMQRTAQAWLQRSCLATKSSFYNLHTSVDLFTTAPEISPEEHVMAKKIRETLGNMRRELDQALKPFPALAEGTARTR